MRHNPTPMCRGCSQFNCESLGQLPDCSEFAGLALSTHIPGGILYRCRRCALVFRSPILTVQEYGQLYARAAGQGWTPKPWTRRNDRALLRNYIEMQYPKGARVLDIGCYTGEFLSSLPVKYEKFGIEKSVKAVQECHKNGIKIVGGDLYEIDLLAQRFDVVVAMDVIEHVLNPNQFLKNALALLFNSGTVLITTGDADNPIWLNEKNAFWYCAPAEHISFISRRWLKTNSNTSQFRIAHMQNFRYETPRYWKTIAIRCLSSLYSLLGRRPHPMWTAHVSEDHLFAAIRQ